MAPDQRCTHCKLIPLTESIEVLLLIFLAEKKINCLDGYGLTILHSAHAKSDFWSQAYQGFGSGDVDQDAFALRLLANSGIQILLAQSFSKVSLRQITRKPRLI